MDRPAVETSETNDTNTIIRGKPKSGRVWKKVKTTRFSDMTRVKSPKSSWAVKMEQKQEKQAAKDMYQRLKDEQKAKQQALRLRREQNIKRKQENDKKSEIVQPIKNTAKLKRMKKKALRKIEKR